MPEFQFIEYQSPKISPPGVISDAGEPQNSVSRLILPVKMPPGDNSSTSDLTSEDFVTSDVTITAITGDTVTNAISGKKYGTSIGKGPRRILKSTTCTKNAYLFLCLHIHNIFVSLHINLAYHKVCTKMSPMPKLYLVLLPTRRRAEVVVRRPEKPSGLRARHPCQM